MRAALLLPVALFASACEREPTFDERYEAARKRVEKTSQEIDAELAGRSPAPSASATAGPVR